MILNEQLIEDMFQEEPSRDQQSLPREDISLNLTSTSRSTKMHNNRLSANDIAVTAQAELAKFEAWMQAESATLQSVQLAALIEKVEASAEDAVQQEDLLIIKGQLFRHEDGPQLCPDCPSAKMRLQQLQSECEQRRKQVSELEEAVLREAVEQVREYLLGQVENNALRSEIKQLHAQISALKNQKITLERTFLFNKTRNSDITILQKSKDLSAAKNSTNSSQLLGRNQAIVFIDPIESDVEEWIRFFEAHKNRYRLLSRKEAEERQKQLGRPFSKEERQVFESTDRFSLLLQSIKEIITNLHRIRENTAAFEQTDLARSGQRAKQDAVLRQEIERLHMRLGKAVRLNESLLREKRNLEEIGACLQQQRLRDSHERNALSELLRRQAARVRELEQTGRQASLMLMDKEEQLLFAIQEIKKLRRESVGQKHWADLQGKCRILEKKHQQKLKEYEFQRNSYIFKLKKEALERRRYCNQLQESKGILRVYLRMHVNSDQLQLSPAIYKVVPDGQQEKLYQDTKRLVIGALDGFSFSIINYGQADTKKHFFKGNQQNPSMVNRMLRDIFRLIQGEKDLRVQPSFSICQVANDRLNDLMDPHTYPPDRQDGLSFPSNQSIPLDTLQNAENTLLGIIDRQKLQRAHLLIRIGLDVHNLKTNEKYRSKVTMVDLAESERQQSVNGKGVAALAKCLQAFNCKQKFVPCRENKLTHVLKDCFNPNSKIVVVISVGHGASKEEIRQALGFAEACRLRRQESEENRARKSISRKNI